MFIVSRRHPELYDYLSARLADEAGVAVVLDRRFAPRRRRALPAAAERRRGERRARPEIDEQIRATPLAVVTAPKTAAAPAREAPTREAHVRETPAAATPARETLAEEALTSEARRWVEAMQRGVSAVRGVLDDHDRLQHAAQALIRENERLRATMGRSSKELAELDGSLSRAIEVVTDLYSRLRKDPPLQPER